MTSALKELSSLIEYMRRNALLVAGMVYLVVVLDTLFITGSSDIRLFSILGVYILAAVILKLNSRLTFGFTLVLLAIMYVEFLLTGSGDKTEKAAVWLYLFLVVGIFQQLR